MKKTIKSKVFDILEKRFEDKFTRQDVIDAYHEARGFCKWEGRLSTALCKPCGTQGYFCWPTSREHRYIVKLARNTYALGCEP